MRQASLDTKAAWPLGRIRLQDFIPPLRDWRFWLIQVLILIIAAVHTAADEWDILRPLGIPDFVPVSLFLVPVVFASLRFGLPGAISTAVWVVILLLPDMLWIDVQLNRWADGTQLALICAMSIFVGYWVQKERRARYQAEQAREAHRAAEARYRALFESNHAPILVVDGQGNIRDANPAARQLFDVLARNASATLADCLGSEDARNILQHTAPEVIRVISSDERAVPANLHQRHRHGRASAADCAGGCDGRTAQAPADADVRSIRTARAGRREEAHRTGIA